VKIKRVKVFSVIQILKVLKVKTGNNKMSMSSIMSKVMMKGLMVWASEVVGVISAEYNLDNSKCMALIEQAWSTDVNAEKSKSKSSKVSSSVVSKGKRLIPLPFNRETMDMNGCHGLNYNHGLFTQCCNIKLEEETYCNSCKTETETSSSGKPLCGTIEDRSDPEFKDSENRKPIHYLSVLRKLRVKPEAAIEEAGKQNITIDSFHLQELPKPVKQVKEKVIKEKKVKEPKPVKEKVIKEKKVKEPKPVKEKVIKEKKVKEPKPVKEKVIKEKVVKEKVVKEKAVGRPKSTKKPIETAAVEDLFASLVAEELSNASGSESESEHVKEVNPRRTENEMKELFVELFGEDDEVSGGDSESQKKDKKEKQAKKADKKEKQDKKSESESERKERAAMQNEEKEQKLREAAALKEQKLKEAAEKKEIALAAEKEKKAIAEAEKEKKAIAEAERKAAAAEKKVKEAAEKKALAEAEKEKKAQEAAEKKALAEAKKQKEGTRTIVATDPKLKVGEKVTHRDNKGVETIATVLEVKLGKSFIEYELETVEGKNVFLAPEGNVMPYKEPVAPVQVTKVTVKRITIDGKEYLKSSINMLYDPKTREEVGIYNTETGGIDALPEESDDEEEVEDDYDSEDN